MIWFALAVVFALGLWGIKHRERRGDPVRPGEPELAGGEIDAALAHELAAQGIHEGFTDTIRRLVFEDNDDWRRCCGSGCDPCVLQMERAVDGVRKAIHWKPGMPDPKG